jgi:hypothetical protein
MLPDLNIAIFFENFFINNSCFLLKPVVPIITFFFNLVAKFKISIEDFGVEKSIMTSVFLKASKQLF